MSSEPDQPPRFGALLRAMAFMGMSVTFAAKFAPGSVWLTLLFGVLILMGLFNLTVCLLTIPPKNP